MFLFVTIIKPDGSECLKSYFKVKGECSFCMKMIKKNINPFGFSLTKIVPF